MQKGSLMNLQEQLNNLRHDNAELRKALAENLKVIASLNETVSQLTAIIESLNKQIQEQQEKLNKNSRNSSKPPSSDGLTKPSPTSLRQKTGKKRGGQAGHDGTCLSTLCDPDEVEQHMPAACQGCPHYEQCKGTACLAEARSIIDAVVTVTITEHQAMSVICPLCGQTLHGEFPVNVRGPIQYGENLQALTVSLNTAGALSINRIHEILGNVFDIPLSTGAISNIVHRFAEKISGPVASIAEKLKTVALSHFDETGTRVDGKTWWVHSASNALYTYLDIDRKRGAAGMDAIGILPVFSGIAVHDCWAPYWKYPALEHAICNAHITRELLGIMENHPEQKWASDFKLLLEEMKRIRDRAAERGKDALSSYYYRKFSRRYDEIIAVGLKQNPIPEATGKKRGRPKRGKIRALIERLQKQKNAVCLFIHNFAVPFTNNQAERDIRNVKVKTKVSGCFRTEQGARDYLKIMSYIGTAKKNHVNVHEAIRQAIVGDIQWLVACGI